MANKGDQFDFDVFISYSGKDETWVVDTLLRRIEESGAKACIDFRDFRPGKPSLFNMQDAVRRSRHTLLVLTPNWLASEWTLFESILSSTKDPAGLRQRTIPLILTKCDFPENADFLAALTYINFTRADREALAWRQLLTALGKPPEAEAPKEPDRTEWFLAHPYPMPPNFTGRVAERQMLNDWLNGDPEHPLLVLRALGGFGKSALTWHWLTHDVDVAKWHRVVWWSFYEGDASFDNFLEQSLTYLKAGDPRQLGSRQRIDAVLDALNKPGALLILDGFERALRAFGGMDAAYQGDEEKRTGNECDCISPIAETFLHHAATRPGLKAKILLTTRLTPRVLEARGGGLLSGSREEPLLQMDPADAVDFFHAQGVRGTRTEVEAVCAPYGYHPLSLRLLAGLIIGDFECPGDIASAKRLDVNGDLVQRQHHVLEVAFNSLSDTSHALMGRIACFRGPVAYDTLKGIAQSDGATSSDNRRKLDKKLETASRKPENQPLIPTLDFDLRDLISRGLMNHDRKGSRFDLHPIVRRYAYDRLTERDRATAHTRLRDYFAAVPEVPKIRCLEDLAPVIELYHHTVRAGQYDEARTLYGSRLSSPLYFQLGAYQLSIDLLELLFPDGESRLPRLRDDSTKAWVLNVLANRYNRAGQPSMAKRLLEQCISMQEGQGDELALGVELTNLADVQRQIGTLREAQTNICRRISSAQKSDAPFDEGVGRQELGLLLTYRSLYSDAATELSLALAKFENLDDLQGQATVWAYRALLELAKTRAETSGTEKKIALASARRALQLVDENARAQFPVERDYVQAHWLIGSAHRVAEELTNAERHLLEALERCRRINLVEFEADILIDLTRLRAVTGTIDEARRLSEEALFITERCGYVLQGADAHLELARLALTRGDDSSAKEHALSARELATCDGPPEYTYKVAYDEAGELLKLLS